MEEINPLHLGIDQEVLEAILRAKNGAPSKFQSFWEMDEEDIDEATEEEIQNNPSVRILWAAENNHLDIVAKMLTECPELVHSRDSDGYTPLHRAAYNGHLEMLKYLLSKGANITAKTVDGWQPIHSAARWNQADIVSFLAKSGSDINSKTNGGQTPLHLAAYEGDSRETLEFLLSHENINVHLYNSVGETARKIAERTGSLYTLFEVKDSHINELR